MTTESAPGDRGASAQPIRVLLVDDDPLVRTLLGRILAAVGMNVVGEVDDGDGVVRAIQEHYPDVVLMDLRMPRVDGVAATRAVHQLPNPPGVVALTSFDTEASIVDAVTAGADGFLSKTADPEEIVGAVRAVAAGEGALSARASRVLAREVRRVSSPMQAKQAEAQLAGLTDRERAVVDAVALGKSNTEIGTALYMSEATVKTHLRAAFDKVGVTNRVQLAVLVALVRAYQQ